MNWNDYKVESERTMSLQFNCEKKEEMILHSIIGILTELEELLEWKEDKIGKSEELFDIFWYLAIIGREYNLPLPKDATCSMENPFEIILSVIKIAIKMLDFLKKKLYYNKPINEDMLIQYYNEISSLLIVYANISDINISDGLDININKLKARYPDKFSSERAINRDLIVERDILQGK